MPKIFKVKFKNTDLYSFVDDAVLEDALQGVFPRAVLEVNEIKEVNEMMKERMKMFTQVDERSQGLNE